MLVGLRVRNVLVWPDVGTWRVLPVFDVRQRAGSCAAYVQGRVSPFVFFSYWRNPDKVVAQVFWR